MSSGPALGPVALYEDVIWSFDCLLLGDATVWRLRLSDSSLLLPIKGLQVHVYHLHYPSAIPNSFLPSPPLVTILLLHLLSSLCALLVFFKHVFFPRVSVKLVC